MLSMASVIGLGCGWGWGGGGPCVLATWSLTEEFV